MTSWFGYLEEWLDLSPMPSGFWVVGAGILAAVAYSLADSSQRDASKGHSSPVGGGIGFGLSLVGGFLIFADGGTVTLFRASYFGGPSDLKAVFAALGWLQSLIVPVASLMLPLMPHHNAFWGSVVLVSSLASFLVGGGFILGMILGSIGGSLAVIYALPASSPAKIVTRVKVRAADPSSSLSHQPPVQTKDYPDREPPAPPSP